MVNGATTNFTTFTTTGQYVVTTRSALGCLHKDTVQVEVAGFAPQADIRVVSYLCQGANIDFLDNSTTPSRDTIVSRKWNFSNGDVSNSNNPNPSTIFDTFGQVTAALKVTTNVGCTDSISKTFFINKKPTAAFDTRLSCSGNPTQFVDNSVNGNAVISNWFWNFSNGLGNSALQNPKFYFPDQGTYPTFFKVTDDNHCIDTVTKYIYVNPSRFQISHLIQHAEKHLSILNF